jgi:hypothetical protein
MTTSDDTVLSDLDGGVVLGESDSLSDGGLPIGEAWVAAPDSVVVECREVR